jgi:hypothetical protein
MITGLPPRNTAAAEFEVPKSMPMIAIYFSFIDINKNKNPAGVAGYG